MAGTQEILKEYLIKIGYQTDAISLKKFEDGLGKTGKTIFGIGTKVAGAVLAVEAASAAFAYSMRKVYFSAELSNVSVKNLKAMQYAGEQVGISGDDMAASLHKASIALRNPVFERMQTLYLVSLLLVWKRMKSSISWLSRPRE